MEKKTMPAPEAVYGEMTTRSCRKRLWTRCSAAVFMALDSCHLILDHAYVEWYVDRQTLLKITTFTYEQHFLGTLQNNNDARTDMHKVEQWNQYIIQPQTDNSSRISTFVFDAWHVIITQHSQRDDTYNEAPGYHILSWLPFITSIYEFKLLFWLSSARVVDSQW